MANYRLMFGFLLASLAAGSVAAVAAQEVEIPRKDLASDQAAHQAQADELAQRERAAAQDLEALRGQLIEATEAFQAKQNEALQLEERLAELEVAMQVQTVSKDGTHKQRALLASELLRQARQPPLAFVLQDFLRGAQAHRVIVLRSFLPHVQSESETMVQALQDLENRRHAIAEQKRLAASARANLEEQRNNLDDLIRARQGLLQQTSAQRAAVLKKLTALAQEAQDLKQLLDKVAQPNHALGKVRLRAGLKLPVVGQILRPYGDRDSYGVASQGLTLTAPPGSPVVAPQGGRVVFAGPFRGYGKIVILQHEGNRHSFLAGFGRLDADLGQTVSSGEVLGLLPEQGGEKPELYFEWREGADPVDPLRTARNP